MRETRLSGSEGGAGHLSAPSLPLSRDALRPEIPDRLSSRNACDVAEGATPRIVGSSFRQFPLVPSRFPASLPLRRGRGGTQRGWFAFITSAIETGAPPRRLLSSAASMKAMISTVSSGVTGATRVWKNFTTSFSSGL